MPAQELVAVGPVSLPDLPPTFLGLAGAAPLPGMDGEDLLGAAGQRRGSAMSGLGAWRVITDGQYKLIVGLDHSVPQGKLQLGSFDPASLEEGELHDLETDPLEQANLWATEETIRDALLQELVD